MHYYYSFKFTRMINLVRLNLYIRERSTVRNTCSFHRRNNEFRKSIARNSKPDRKLQLLHGNLNITEMVLYSALAMLTTGTKVHPVNQLMHSQSSNAQDHRLEPSIIAFDTMYLVSLTNICSRQESACDPFHSAVNENLAINSRYSNYCIPITCGAF